MLLEISTNSIRGRIESIIRVAQKELFIVSPYIELDKLTKIKDALNFALKTGVKVTLFIRHQKEEKMKKSLNQIQEFHGPNLKVYIVKDLHAKFYYNENEALITSMNLLSYSAENNHELGVFFKKKEGVRWEKLNKYIQLLTEEGLLYLSEEKNKMKKKNIRINI